MTRSGIGKLALLLSLLLSIPPEIESQAADGLDINPNTVLELEKMKPQGDWYEATVPDTLDLAKNVVRFCMKPGMWVDTSDQGYPGNEHGIWGGHVHNNIECLNAFLNLALAEGDDWLKQFVREGYDHGRRSGVLRIGWFPAWVAPWKYERPRSLHQMSEPCGIADMIVLGVRLSDAGLGEYWDDVDYILRNHLIAEQVTSIDQLRRPAGEDIGPEYDDLRKRFVGGFANSRCTISQKGNTLPGCCSVNGAQGLYYAWHGITRFEQGVATVNLFLNRASAWMDIDSYLPYEGKVILRNKQVHTALVRIPSWVDAAKLACTVNDQLAKPPRVGGRLLFRKLKPQDVIRVEFPVSERTDQYTVGDQLYTFVFRGSTVVDISPREEDPKTFPIFQRDHLKQKTAPMRKVKRFATEQLIPLGTY